MEKIVSSYRKVSPTEKDFEQHKLCTIFARAIIRWTREAQTNKVNITSALLRIEKLAEDIEATLRHEPSL